MDLAAVDTAWEQAEEIRHDLLTRAFPAALAHIPDPSLRKLLSRARSAVGRHRPAHTAAPPPADEPATELHTRLTHWNDALAAAQQAQDRLDRRWEHVRASVRRRLHRAAADEALHEAALLLSPSFRAALTAYARAPFAPRPDRRTRALEQRITLYLQRLAAKNETHSFFGPVGHAVLAPGEPEAVQVVGTPGAGPPRVFSSPRVAEGLARAMAADPGLGPVLPPRRSPAYRSAGGNRLQHAFTGRKLTLSDGELRTWERSDGRVAARDHDEEPLRRLLDAGVLLAAPAVDPWCAEPLASLAHALLPLPDEPAVRRWRECVARFEAGIEEFARTGGDARAVALDDLEREYGRLTGEPPQRGGGRMYADRSVLFEERESTVSLRFGGALADALTEGLAPALTYWAAAACQRHAAQQRYAAEAFDALWPGRTDVPLLTYLVGLARAPRPLTLAPTPAEQWAHARVGEEPGEVVLDPREPAALAGAITGPVFSSVDVLIDASAPDRLAEGRLVLGEAHAGHLLSVFPTDHFARLADPEAALRRDRALIETLAAGGRRIGRLVGGRTTKIFPYPLPAPAVAVQLRPHLDPASAVPAADLRVRRTAEGVELLDQEGPLVLLPPVRPAEGADPFAALCLPAVESIPWGLGAVRPRVRVGRTIVQRAGRECPAPEELPRTRDAARMRAARAWMRRYGLPELVFVRVPGEPKPTLVDLGNPLSVDAFTGLLRTAADRVPGPVSVGVSEMLPGPDGLWLGAEGARLTCELRILATRPARPAE